MFDTLSLECFHAVIETRSFTKAAAKVGRTQSAVSQQIAKLEELLGQKLIERGKNLSLTADGEVFYHYCQQMLALQREAIDRFKTPDIEGQIKFGLPEDFASVLLTDVLLNFSQRHPRVQLNIECDLTLNLFDRFKNKEFDLVLVKMSRPEDFPNGIDVWTEPLEWVGSPAFSHYSQEQTMPLIVSPRPCVYRAQALKALEEQGRQWRIVFSSQSYAGTIAAVKAGMGITVLPRNMVPTDLQILREETGLPALDDIHVSMLKHSDQSAAVNSLENFMVERLKM